MHTQDKQSKSGYDRLSHNRCFQTMVPMRDGVRLNTFVFLPEHGGSQFPVIMHRTPYGITSGDSPLPTDCTHAWLPNPAEPLRGSILRGWRRIGAPCRCNAVIP